MIDRKGALGLVGGVLAVAGILFVARRLIHYADLTDLGKLGQGGWLALAGLALVYGAANVLLGTGWWLLLRRGGEEVAWVWAVRTYGTAQLAKYLPGNIFHLAGRQVLGLAAGLPAPLLASSMAWELALCAGAGVCLGLLVLPAPFGIIAAGAGIVTAGIALRRWRFDPAFVCFVAFLAVAGVVFALLIALLGPGNGWIAIGGAYVLAWLAGLVVPGAPAGIGVREAALMVLLAGRAEPAQIAEAAVLGRMVTLGGDFAFYLASSGIGRHRLFALVMLAMVLILQGAVPFLAVPTLGQAVWSGAFAQSFANQSFFSLYAHNFGVPEPAAIAFGLATAWPAGLLIRIGLHPADAYSTMAALWFTLAFFSARSLARRFATGPTAATLLAALWLSLPMIWGHADFSMLSCGMALLPFYFLAAQRLAIPKPASIAGYVAATLLAVFMDGYSFIMFAAAATVVLIRRPVALAIHFAAFGLATLLYTRYVGFGGEAAAPLDFFRGWGLDLSYIVLPSDGMQWVFDKLHLSVPRSHETLYGDRSVWETTFCLPILLAGLACFRRARPLAPAALAIALLGFWLALGPSVKLDVHKDPTAGPTMAAEAAPIPTGSAWLSEHVPGFRAMRASYRWAALGLFGIWLLVAMGAKGHYAPLWLSGLILCNLPHVPARWFFDREQRAMFLAIDQSLDKPLKAWGLKAGERVVFLPFRNDFLPAYVAARLNLSAYNIGGDKNLDVAWNHWPVELRRVQIGTVDEAAVTTMLAPGLAGAVVLLYPHGLWAAHLWPCLDEADPPLFGKLRDNYAEIADFTCPAAKKAELAPLVESLRRRGDLTIADAGLFAIIRRD